MLSYISDILKETLTCLDSCKHCDTIEYFYFLLPMHGRESIVLRSYFGNGDFDKITCFERS